VLVEAECGGVPAVRHHGEADGIREAEGLIFEALEPVGDGGPLERRVGEDLHHQWIRFDGLEILPRHDRAEAAQQMEVQLSQDQVGHYQLGPPLPQGAELR
jgi:hypothetical protein